MSKHSPLPWKVSNGLTMIHIIEMETKKSICAVVDPDGLDSLQQSNMSFIVHACNNHYELLEALKAIKSHSENIAKYIALSPHSSEDEFVKLLAEAIQEIAEQAIQKAGE